MSNVQWTMSFNCPSSCFKFFQVELRHQYEMHTQTVYLCSWVQTRVWVREQLEVSVFMFYFVWDRVSSCLPVHTPGWLAYKHSRIISLSSIMPWEAGITDMHYCPCLFMDFYPNHIHRFKICKDFLSNQCFIFSAKCTQLS